MNYKTVYSDVLVLGGGVAGLRAAVAATQNGACTVIVSKETCASPKIMGFNAPVMPGDSEELYFQDLEASGYGVNDSRLARVLSENVLKEVEWLENNGIHFDRDGNGMYSAIHTLGTKYPRLIKAGISTGSAEMKMLKEKCAELGIRRDMPVDILGLLTAEGSVLGAYAWDSKNGQLLRYFAKAVVLAVGGCGAMQSFSTYPASIIGDGYAMAYEAGASLVDMEFQQFEPCCFIWPKEIEGKVIATTLLRHGAELLNGEGRDFMPDYGLTRDNAQKGSLARAMESEVRAGRGTPHGGIYYNLTMMSREFLYRDHAIFTRPTLSVGMDLTKVMPEMMPAAHTNLGGVTVDGRCATEIKGLYACGEVIGGLHGANRLGGCAGAETVVFGHIAGDSASAYAATAGAPDGLAEEAWQKAELELGRLLEQVGDVELGSIRKRLGECLHDCLGIMRDGESIAKAAQTAAELTAELEKARISGMDDAAEYIHCRNMLLLAGMQIKASDMRRESRGVFYRSDYPNSNDAEWRRNIIIRKSGSGMELSVRDAVKNINF